MSSTELNQQLTNLNDFVGQGLLMNIKEKQKHALKMKWLWISILFFVISQIVVLRTQFRQIFDLFKTYEKGCEGYGCTQSGATAWNIVLNVAYPWLGRIVNQQPLNQMQAIFLWMVIRTGVVPTMNQIQKDAHIWGGALDCISPLGYICGNTFSAWATSTGKGLNDISKDPAVTPWKYFLTKDSAILQDGKKLQTFVTSGFYGMAMYTGSEGTSPADLYNEIFARKPDTKSGCDTIGRVTGVASMGATFSMAGAAFGGPAAGIGALAGIGLGLLQDNSRCGGGGGGCSIM